MAKQPPPGIPQMPPSGAQFHPQRPSGVPQGMAQAARPPMPYQITPEQALAQARVARQQQRLEIARQCLLVLLQDTETLSDKGTRVTAKWAVEYADALLAELEKDQSHE